MYLIKLKIEMNMADLIVKIVKASAPAPGNELHRYAVSQPQVNRPAQSRINSDSSKRSTAADSGVVTNSQPHISPSEQTTSNIQTWELKKMPSHFDVNDVVDQRKASVAEGSGGGLAVPMSLRPSLLRSMSEMTQLEIGVGYINPASKEKRMSVEQSLC